MAAGAPAIVVISSHVALGAVGNRGMSFALERLGLPVWAAPTIVLPHHPGHGPVTPIVPPEESFAALLAALAREAERRPVAGIITGYLGAPSQAGAIAGFIAAVKRAWPRALVLCDPVLGDAGRLYVREAVAEAIRDRLAPAADWLTPNLFEAGWLSEREIGDALGAARAARDLPAPNVVVTSTPALMRGQAGNLLVSGGEAILAEHPFAATAAKGAGDLFAALLMAWLVRGERAEEALARATAGVSAMMAATARAGADELVLAEAQDALINPQARVSLRRLALGPEARA